MKSPFPGMDPYLEQYWGDIHSRVAVYASDQLQRQLPSDLRARVEEQLLVSTENGHVRPRRVVPDVTIVEQPKKRGLRPLAPGGVALAEPLVLRIPEQMRAQRSIRIVDTRSGNRLVTAIEILSPSNKISAQGRREYRQKQREIVDADANLVEIDLIRMGPYVLYADECLLPEPHRENYRICVTRSWRADERELYPISIREPLPAIRVPLRDTDEDAALDLQALIDLAYANGAYDDLDYSKDPTPPLSGDDAKWADDLLRKQGLRKE